MGEFLLQFKGKPGVIRLRNTHHIEGAGTIWNRIFANGSDDLEFQIGLSGCNIPAGPNRTPSVNFLLPPITPNRPPVLAANTTMATILPREGGLWDAFENGHHKHVTQYERQDVTFTIENVSGAPKLVSTLATFTNAIPAVPYKDPCTGLRHYHKDSIFAPNHGFPWDTPDFPPGLLGAIIHASATIGGVDHRTLTYAADTFAGMSLSGYQVTIIYNLSGGEKTFYTNLITSHTDNSLHWIPSNSVGADPPYWPDNGTQVDTYIRPGATPLGAGTCIWNDPGNIDLGYVVRFPDASAKSVGDDAKRRAGWLYLLSEHTAGRFLVYSNSATDFVLRFPEDIGAMVPPLENGTEPLTGWYSAHRTTIEEIEYDPWAGIMGPIGCVFLATKAEDPANSLLIASAVVAEDLYIPWASTLQVQYLGYLRDYLGALPYGFAEAVVKRGYVSRASCPWESFQIGLFSTRASSLNEKSTLVDIEDEEVEGEGYARLDVSWAVGSDGDGPWAEIEVPAEAWTNESSGDNWTTARTLAVIGTIDGVEQLCWAGEVEETALEPSQTMGLTDNKLKIRWSS
jgi:hypothetical protein